MHFFMNEVFAAPASGLPSLPTAWVSQFAAPVPDAIVAWACACAIPAVASKTAVATAIDRLNMAIPSFDEVKHSSRLAYFVVDSREKPMPQIRPYRRIRIR
jgi:hypothetical protein